MKTFYASDPTFHPFLVHLTRHISRGITAKENLRSIIESRKLLPGIDCLRGYPEDGAMSHAKFGISLNALTPQKRKEFFAFISFTETPLPEIHCLFDLRSRKTNLEPYGLVFFKERLKIVGVSPVFYVNNLRGDKDALIKALATLIETHPKEAAQILPLIAVFGKYLNPVEGKASNRRDPMNFEWEREWRYPYINSSSLQFRERDVFVGLCPHNEIDEFEKLFPPVPFIDPRLNVKRYAPQLIDRRKCLGLKHSVV